MNGAVTITGDAAVAYMKMSSGMSSASSEMEGYGIVSRESLGIVSSEISDLGTTSQQAASQVAGMNPAIDMLGEMAWHATMDLSGLASGLGSFGNAAASTASQLSSLSFGGSASNENNRYGGVVGYAGGGILQGGSGTKDDIYLGTVDGRAQMAMGGEFIVNKRSSKKHRAALNLINADTYAAGGELPSLMSGINDTIAKYTRSDSGYALYQLDEQFKELTESLKDAKASVAQLAAADRAYALEKESIYGPKSETVKSIMETVDASLSSLTMSEGAQARGAVNKEYTELIKTLREYGASTIQITTAQRAYSLALAEAYGPNSETVKGIMETLADKNSDLTLSEGQKAKKAVDDEYADLIKTMREYGASTIQITTAQRAYSLALAEAYGPKSEKVLDLMGGVNDTISKAQLSESAYEVGEVKKKYSDLVKELKDSGASAFQVAQATKAWKIELDEIADRPLKEASDSLDSFIDGLKGTTDEVKSSAVAQTKLLTMLSKAKKGDFTGIETLADVLKDISINKEDYATAADYARAYWRTMGAATQLTSLIDKKVALPGYATGGIHSGGLRVVGESGPEIEVTGPSRIYNQDQLIDLTALIEEIRALRREVVNGNYAVAKNTMKTAESLKRIEYDGIYLDAGNL